MNHDRYLPNLATYTDVRKASARNTTFSNYTKSYSYLTSNNQIMGRYTSRSSEHFNLTLSVTGSKIVWRYAGTSASVKISLTEAIEPDLWVRSGGGADLCPGVLSCARGSRDLLAVLTVPRGSGELVDELLSLRKFIRSNWHELVGTLPTGVVLTR